ncbi:STAS domain-containing protein [Paraglaciecola aestuariivivens]
MTKLSLTQNAQGHIVLSGDLNRHTVPTIPNLPLASNKVANAQECLIDLQDIQHVDTAGLAWLINGLKQARALGISCQLKGLPKTLLNLAKISDVDQFLSVQ